ncbi:MAG: DUF3878 family protein [Acutalibacteraceae bacterium]|nr:DUF3878 family protein [Acutalibacteraceae bacterium]
MEQPNCFPETVQKAFDFLLNVGGISAFAITTDGDNTNISFSYSFGTNITLVLKNSSGAPIGEYDGYNFSPDSLEKHGDRFILSGETFTCDSDSSEESYEKFAITFTDARAEISLYNASERVFCKTPWDYLQSVALAIGDRANFSESILNEKEKSLLPLINEINMLLPLLSEKNKSYYIYPDDEIPSPDFSNLKSYAQKYDYSELVCLIEELENNYGGKKHDKFLKRLINALNLQKYEPLFREIYALIKDTQSDYPTEFADSCPPDMLNSIRNEIESKLHENGYNGTYPDFVKTGKLNGIHMVQSYDVDYIVGFEKNAAHHIHCNEQYSENDVNIKFLCGFERLRDNEPSDVYSCMFNSKGKKFFQSFFVDIDMNSDAEEQRQTVDKFTKIAIKKAELKRLTKEERKAANIYAYSDLSVFLSVFIIMGGLFGIFMTLGFMLIEVAVTAMVGMANEIPVLFMTTPWWLIFAACWVMFGGAMGVVQIIGKRK